MWTVDALATLRVLTDSMDAYDRQHFKHLAELHGETFVGSPLNLDGGVRAVTTSSRCFAPGSTLISASLDEILATPGHVNLVGRMGKGRPFASLFTVEEGRITFVQDLEDVEALEATLV